MKVTYKVMTAGFLLNQVVDGTAQYLTILITSMTDEEMDTLKYYLEHGSFIGL